MITNESESRKRLVLRGIKPTRQRTLVLDAVRGSREHPTIRGLHERLSRTLPTLSKTTVYSTLGLLAENGLVRRLDIDPSEARFDGLTEPHHHFLCASCGRIRDIDIRCVHGRRGRIEGHRIDEVHGYFKGVCAACLASAGRKRPAPGVHKPKTIKEKKP